MTGVKDKGRIINKEAVADKEYQSIDLESCVKSLFLDVLVGYHCFIGCDRISAFAERRKIKHFVLMCKRLDHVKAFLKLRKEKELLDECLKELENFVCLV